MNSIIKTGTTALLPILATVLTGCAVQSDFNFDGLGTPGFDDTRLDRIDAAIEAEIEAGDIPGAVALVARDGETVYHKSFGLADIASQTPMQTDAIFRIASMTKAVTTVAIMQLYEQGLFQLNDPVASYIPAFANPQVLVSVDDDGRVTETRRAETEIKIIDLLTHSSGISYPFIESPLQSVYVSNGVIDGLTEKNVTLSDQMMLLAEQPLLFDPGSAWAYGLNTDVLGYLVEVVSGMPLDRYFASEIFMPLGMSDTYFYLPESKIDRLATLYADVNGLSVSAGHESSIKLDNPRYPSEGARTYFSGGAGLSGTARDYARFIQMLLNEGELDGHRVLSRKSVELMRAPRMDLNNDGTADFGLGFEVIDDLGANGEIGSPGIYKWGGAFNTNYWIDPQEQLIGVIMTQVRPTSSDIGDRFRTLVYQALE
ncbi:MAG: serine hydrolase domain-containing protein [Woeseiaceae bacterium]